MAKSTTEGIELSQQIPPGRRRKSKTQGPLPMSAKVSMAYKVLVEGETQTAVAKEYRVGTNVVSLLVCKLRKNKCLLEELNDKQTAKSSRRDIIASTIERMSQNNVIIDSV